MNKYVKIIFFSILLSPSIGFTEMKYGGNISLLLGNVDAHYPTQDPEYIYGDLSTYVDAKTDFGAWSFGTYIETETESDDFLKEGYFYAQNKWLRFELGRAKNMAEKLHIALPDSTGLRFNRESYIYDLFDFKTTVLTSSALTTDDHTQKVSFVSKPWHGLQIGGSYLPKEINKHQTEETISDYHTLENGFSSTLRYQYDGGYFKLATSLGFLHLNDLQNFQTDPIGQHSSAEKRQEYSGGLNLSLGGWTLGLAGRKVDEERSQIALSPVSEEGYLYGAGIGYEFIMFNSNLSYQHSELEGNITSDKKDISDIFMWGLSYKYSEDLKFWTGLGYAQFKNEMKQASDENRGGFFTLGLSYDF
ncbi:MAG: porin [Alphaproteobacteria bacterium]|nr:porin [Alphaproteobacteria bacterium]